MHPLINIRATNPKIYFAVDEMNVVRVSYKVMSPNMLLIESKFRHVQLMSGHSMVPWKEAWQISGQLTNGRLLGKWALVEF